MTREKEILKLKKECGFWGRGYANLSKFTEGMEKINKKYKVHKTYQK